MTLNPALDLTYTVDALVPHATHRVGQVAERAGGKGLNVAGVLHALGEPVLATGLLGGATGAAVAARTRPPHRFTTIAGETRRTVTVLDGVDATGLWEPGPVVTGEEWAAFRTLYTDLVRGAAVVVLSGSLPQGLPVDAYAQLVRLARRYDCRSVLDTSGAALRLGAAAGPDVVKPNADELRALGPTDSAVVESHGPRGLIARTPQGAWRAAPPEVVTGNPTGAGDACAAAIARGLRDGTPWPRLLADAVALAAAAVVAPVAGEIDVNHYRATKERVHVQPHG
ncbi:1-phosphofructokinase family hexose kinase [Dactylosporangium aurantiacum]|uniref:1-phosphofructokinase family hexose kinase n=1 Tax=Dactylosporangium aurantiacum TaxID=35754 RepID=UPI001FDFDA50|nr:PfkB family carbohydrate kinase [Dactylosporangium aurantiacum]MDG6107499.1 PfkB family carbohydrate kinase [Dactylosporangium aurantiacum]